MSPNGVFFSWARLEGARLRIPVSDATRPDRAFRPPRFRTENCRFGAVGVGAPEAVLGLPRAIWGSTCSRRCGRSHFGAPEGDLGLDVLAEMRQLEKSERVFAEMRHFDERARGRSRAPHSYPLLRGVLYIFMYTCAHVHMYTFGSGIGESLRALASSGAESANRL